MCRKYFFKNKGCLSRKFIASGLSAVFSAGMFSSYAGAMREQLKQFLNVKKNKEDFFVFCEEQVEIPEGDNLLKYIGLTQEEIDSLYTYRNMIPTKEGILPKFIEENFSNISDIGKAKYDLIEMKKNEKKFKEIIKKIVYENFQIGTIIKKMKKEDDKSKIILAVKIVVVLIVVGLSVYFYKRGSSKQPETEQPTNPDKPGTNPDTPGTNPDNPGTNPDNPGTNPDNPGTNPDNPGTNPDNTGTNPDKPGTNPDNPGTNPDKPGTNPDNPGTNPDKPEPEPESDNTEDVQDSLGTELLKGLGTAVVGGTLAGSGAYAVNEVLRNKESKKVQSKDVNNGEKDGYIYVASVGNELVEENGNKDDGDDSKKGSRSNEIEEEKLEAEVEDGTESAELEGNTKEEDESQ